MVLFSILAICSRFFCCLPLSLRKIRIGMVVRSVKSLLVAVFSLSMILFSNVVLAQHENQNHQPSATHANENGGEQKIDAAKVIMEHIMDNHEFHIADVGGHPVSIPLPIILY